MARDTCRQRQTVAIQKPSSLVRVYWNLHKKAWSIQLDGLVVGHANFLCLRAVTPRISDSGRQRVIRSRRKNVHAFLCGDLGHLDRRARCLGRITYNPYQHDTFQLNGEPYMGSAFVRLENKVALAYEL